MQRAKQIYQNNKNIFHNLSYMTILKVFMLILPLISYSYLIRVVGSENFGLVVYSLSIIAFFRIFVKFGFEMSAVKNVAENSEDKDKLSVIVSSILTIQLCFYLVGFLILYILIQSFTQFEENQKLLYYGYLLPLCDILFLVWFFQGIEKMKYITIINVIAGLIGLAMIFVFIQEKEDYIFIPLLQAFSLLIGSLYSIWLVFKKEGIVLQIPSKENILFYFKESSPFFISRSSVVFNRETSNILLANFVSMSAVAYFDLAKKIIEAFKIPNSIIDSVIYPRIAKTKNKVLVKKVFLIKIFSSLILFSIVYLFGKYFILFLGGTEMNDTYDILKLFSLMIILTAMSYYLGASVLVSFGYSNKFNLSVIYGTGLYLIFTIVLYYTNNITINNIIILLLIIESYIFIYRYYYSKKYKIL